MKSKDIKIKFDAKVVAKQICDLEDERYFEELDRVAKECFAEGTGLYNLSRAIELGAERITLEVKNDDNHNEIKITKNIRKLFKLMSQYAYFRAYKSK